jgi:ribosomal-protein-alanine N-acetyltransferase
MNIRIDTPRFFLRPLTPDDATVHYINWLRDQTAQRFIVAAKDTSDLETLRQYIAEKSACPDILFLGIFLNADGRHIGNIKYEPIDSVEGYAIMGILIGDTEWRGQGVAPEVLDASIEWLKTHRNINEIVLDVKRDNVAAINAYQKAGFKIESTHRFQYDAERSIAMVRR